MFLYLLKGKNVLYFYRGDFMLQRHSYLTKLIQYKDTEFVKVISGVRRSGKSFLLKMFQEYLNTVVTDETIMFLNFEHPDTFGLLSYDALYRYIKEKIDPNKKAYFLFDEIQEVNNWQKLVNGLRVAYNCDIYITGSNANLLSGEMATYLTGRYVEIQIFPLTFEELLGYKNVTDLKGKQVMFDSYLKFGGFPSVALLDHDELKKDVLKGIYNSIILKDVSLRANISNIDLLLKISLYLMDNIGNAVSSNKIANYLTSSGTKTKGETVEKYLSLLEDSFTFYKAVRYDIRGKERLKTLGKYYVVDTGIRNSVLGRLNTDMGSQIENIVFLKLMQSGYEVFVGKYDDVEIDFVCFKNEVVKYVQVTYEMPKDSDREIRNLLLVRDNYERIIVTMNYFDVGNVNGIQIIHLYDFLEKNI